MSSGVTLFRSMTTEVVHTAACRSAGSNCERWRWADDKTLSEVTEATAVYPWLHLCRRCLPGACLCNRCAP